MYQNKFVRLSISPTFRADYFYFNPLPSVSSMHIATPSHPSAIVETNAEIIQE
jgi:hypothetical protein